MKSCDDTDDGKDPPKGGWTAPRHAFEEDLPGVSTYLHYRQELRARRNQGPHQNAQPGAGHGTMRDALEGLIRDSFRQ